MFARAKQSAKRRGVEWLISIEQFEILRSFKCHYCDGDLPETGHGLDRKDNSLPYEVTNVVPCCGSCNMKKSNDWTVEEMKAAIRAVIRIRGGHNG